MIPITNKHLLRPGFTGFACWPFVVMRESRLLKDPVFINHERIHLRQQLELLIVPFFIWYGLEFLLRWAICKNAHQAYHKISFEREAYGNEKDLTYLKNRQFWSFFRYL